MEFYLFQLRSNEPGFKCDGLNEPDFKGVGLNTKPDFKDVGLDTNWTLSSLALGLGYADMESGSFGDGN
ncbi:uncharacterized protein OCT59_013296 [Rhizophagus irregularis]|uniref:uncharacterized protein n=1 Tax=Rhizophagus irregularis TaxID=588596 RepID=UPI00331D2CB3|nr:hypothetical protein OCT59_013296 [Rhizophagus irregularis]